MEKTVTSGQLKELAGELAEKIGPNDVLALYGDLGAGKTTFTRFLVEALGFESRVQSPTFILVRNYHKKKGQIKKVNHVDLYRLNNVNEVLDIGINEMIQEKENITIIEWPEIMEELLPENTIKIYFEFVDDEKRKVKVQNNV
jgi:tRNA threonylcarbamoyladenosine biosynthesis protein TsaE